ncbi:MAG: signal recognition particle-docking protein FtsY [Azospirillaceae bacterium]|nr:signal recognition particle-docking protein FtsY [Azospirillaceae bacterium]
MFDWIKRKKPEAQTAPAPAPVTIEPVAQPEQVPEPVVEMPVAEAPVAEVVAPPVPKSALVLDAAPVAPVEEAPQGNWLSRLRKGLSKSTNRLTDGIGGIFTKRKLDDETLEELEELLIQADLGPAMAARVTADLAKSRFGKEVSPDEVKRFLADEIGKVLAPVARPLVLDGGHKPHVVLVVGVNGTGKTTTIGKYARELSAAGKTVWLAAGDTFRAAAVAQLQIWGERTGAPVIAKETGADAAGLAYEALEKARAAGADVLLIDTAGRLQNKQGLMDELRKIVRVIKKVDPTAPHTTLLTLDATTGQNAHSQVEVFKEMVSVNGLILTKLDGSARGGVLVSLAQKFGLPVHAIGVGEGIDDLRPFDAQSFAASLVGLDETR